MKEIERIINWNKIANEGKLPEFNRHLETSLLMEEVAELLIAYKNKDPQEIIDAYCDIRFILDGSLAKYGFTAEQMHKAMERVIQNNYSKFQYDEKGEHVCIKDENGKILKPEGFVGVDLSDLVPKNK